VFCMAVDTHGLHLEGLWQARIDNDVGHCY
jgi:hypothetical protein